MVAISELVQKSNQAVSINPATDVDFRLTSHGSDWYWAAFSVFGVLALYHAVMFPIRKTKKLSHVGPLIASSVMFYVYFTMASNLGWTAIEAEFNHVTTSDQSETPGIRQVFYARYIGWFLSWPGVLYALELVAHQGNLEYNLKTLSSLALEIGSTEIYVLGLLIGILIKSTYKWGYFTFAVAAQLFAIGIIFNRFLVELKTPIKYVLVFSFITLLWILYPICWGLSEGGNVIQVDSEAAFYGVLDVLLFGFVPLALSFLNEKTDDQLTYPEAASEAPEGKKEEAPAARQSGETAVQAETQDGNEVAEQV